MRTIFDVAKELAAAHKLEAPSTSDVFLAESANEVRLVEVSGSLDGRGEVLPFRFAPRGDLGVPYSSVVVLLGKDDWERLNRGELSLPEGWGQLSALKRIA